MDLRMSQGHLRTLILAVNTEICSVFRQRFPFWGRSEPAKSLAIDNLDAKDAFPDGKPGKLRSDHY
ncbi:hypothetical protein Pla52n_10280 [Stieleria varia]|uniref:Uncharacterized protein n=1 Tax=Stieleria varia TaxID=2528005 RepID=A0A5C6B851_9BACT|nr:hypothetical protein Pla52n_10280 [Stieleria varia]